jgi:multiple sugar transport system substrate-binding protein
MGRRIWQSMTMMALSLGLLAGCGGQESVPVIRVAVYASGPRGAISGPLYYWRDEWEKQTKARLEIVEIPFTELHDKIFADLRAGTGQYDGIIGPAWFYGDYILGDYILPIDEFIQRGKQGEFPFWDPDSVVPPLKELHRWNNSWYGVPNDGDAHILYYRRDILNDPEWKEQFRAEKGYSYRVPPQTWEELAEAAEFFHGKDWDRDGEADYGIVMHLGVGGQGFFHYLSLSAPYVVLPGPSKDRYHQVYWFDPETMEPLINTPGHQRALALLRRLQRAGPSGQTAWQLKEAWDRFLNGKAVFCYSWGDVGSLAQDERQSRIKGKLGCAALPGTQEVWDRQQQSWIRLEQLNRVGNTVGASWHGVINRKTKHPDLVYHLFAFHAQESVNMFHCAQGWTGIDPSRTFHFLEPQGKAKVQDYIRAGWHEEDARQWTQAYYDNYYRSSTFLDYLRIPGTIELWRQLDRRLHEAVVDHSIPEQEILERIARDWKQTLERLNRELGADRLRQIYQESIGYRPGKGS